MEGLIVLIVLVGLPALIVWGLWKLMNWGIHETFCVCEKCRREEIQSQIKRRAWSKQDDEIRRAVDEMIRASKGRPDGSE